MGLEQLAATISEEAAKEAKATIASAEGERKSLISSVKAAAEQARKETESRTAEYVEAQRRERVAWARLEAKRLVSEAQESAVEAAIEGLSEEVRKFPKDKAYPRFLNSLVGVGIRELGEERVAVHVSKADKKHLKGGKYHVKEGLDAWGGCMVESMDGNVRVDLTLESLLSQKRDVLRKRLYASLFR